MIFVKFLKTLVFIIAFMLLQTKSILHVTTNFFFVFFLSRDKFCHKKREREIKTQNLSEKVILFSRCTPENTTDSYNAW